MSGRPQRIQLSRKSGFDLQEHSRATNGLAAVKVTRPGEYGNPFKVEGPCRDIKAGTAEWWVERGSGVWLVGKGADRVAASKFAVELFGKAVRLPEASKFRERAKLALRGKNLACFCKVGDPCHADVLLEIANQ